MKGLFVLLVLLVFLILLAQIRVGAWVEFGHEGLFVKLRIARFLIPVFPVSRKKEPQKKTKVKEMGTGKMEKSGGRAELFLNLLPLVLDVVKRFKRKLRVDTLTVELTVAAPDPADAAMQYGQANALMGALWQPLTQAFHVIDGNGRVRVDFTVREPELYLLASLSLTVGQVLALVGVFGVKALKILIQTEMKRRSKQRKAV